MLYMMMKHIFMISFWNLSNKKKEESSLKWFICSISAKSKTEIDLKRERLVQKTT